MRTLATITILLLAATAATAQDDDGASSAVPHADIERLSQRIAELEASHAALMARLERLEAMRIQELRTLLELYERGDPATAAVETRAAESPAAPTPAAVQDPDAAVAEEDILAGNGTGTGEEEAPEEEQSPVAAFIESARAMIDEESFPAAIRILNVAINLEPKNDEAYFYRGVARHLMRRYEESMEDFQTAFAVTESASMRYTCLYNQACVFALTGEVDKCLEYLQRSYDEGFQDIVMQMATDRDLDGVRSNRDFRDLLWKLKNP